MERFLDDINCDVNGLSPLTLAFVGDAVFELLVREKLVCEANRPVGKLHSLTVQHVKASAQAKALRKIMPILSERELYIVKRGRNANTTHTPKGSSSEEYHYSTGFEMLFGYLYLTGETARIRELFYEALQTTETSQ